MERRYLGLSSGRGMWDTHAGRNSHHNMIRYSGDHGYEHTCNDPRRAAELIFPGLMGLPEFTPTGDASSATRVIVHLSVLKYIAATAASFLLPRRRYLTIYHFGIAAQRQTFQS